MRHLRLVTAALSVAFAISLLAGAFADPVLTADEFRLLPVRVHLLRSTKTPELRTTLKEADVARILGKINGIWRQAGILFYRESLREEEPGAEELYRGLGENRTEGHLRLVRPRGTQSDEMFHLYYLRAMRPNGICLDSSHTLIFVKDTAQLMPVPGGIDEPLPRVSAHEIGHALGLDHRQDLYNLMASGTTGTALNAAEITTARGIAERFAWRLKPADALALADRLAAEKKPAESAALWTALQALPGGEIATSARKRLEAIAGTN